MLFIVRHRAESEEKKIPNVELLNFIHGELESFTRFYLLSAAFRVLIKI